MEDDDFSDMETYITKWRQEAARVERERKARYPYCFSFVFAADGGDLEDETFYEMRDWCTDNCGPGGWLETGDSLGTTVRFWFDDPNIAMHFKLKYV